MSTDWPTVRLGDYIDSCLGKMLDKAKNRGELYPYLGNKNVRWGSFDINDLAEMRFEDHEHERYGLKYGDLVVCEGGEPGRSAIWKDQVQGMKIQKALHRIRAKDGLDNRFLHYWFLLAGKTGSLEPYFTGTTIKHLTGKAITQLPIQLPPINEQEAIAKILESLDDKIELNRQMNQTLEAMAQALFKSWFVDFDPVIDNALAAGNEIPEPLQVRAEKRQALGDQRNPLPAVIQSLFPDRFVFNDEMGWSPEGWEQTAISDVAKVIKGKSYKSAELSASQTALVTLKSFNRGGGYRLDGLKEYTGAYKPEQEVTAGDLVIAYTDVTQAADVIGKPAMLVSDDRYEHLVISLDVAVVRPNKDGYKTFLYGLAQTEQFQQHTKSHSTGTTVLHLSKDAVPSYQFSAPELRLVEAFDKQVNPLFRTIDLNISRNRTLEKVRNTLLPKLISGELRIPDAEKQVAEAV